MSKYLHINGQALCLEQFHQDFILLKPRDKQVNIQQIGKAIYEANFPFAEEVIVSEAEICIKINKHFSAISILQLSKLQIENVPQPNIINLSIQFTNSTDWVAICEHTKMSKDALIQHILEAEYNVAMLGFLPGFVYMNGLPDCCHIPRKTSPSKRVEAQSFAIGGSYLGLYSLPSPGGWHVIGHCPESILDITKTPPISLNLGDIIKLRC